VKGPASFFVIRGVESLVFYLGVIMFRTNFSSVILTIFLILAGMVAYYLNWIDATNLLSVSMSVIALVGLLIILKLPWDLYFEARDILAEQRESLRRGIEIPQEDQTYTQKMETKLLVICLSLHLITAVVISLATHYSGGTIGYYFAGFYLLSTAFRPMASFYVVQKRRFASLRTRCKVPREDSVNFAREIKELKEGLESLEELQKDHSSQWEERFLELGNSLKEIKTEGGSHFRLLDQKMERVLLEFTRSIEKLTEDKELLRGIRAFVKVIREEPTSQ
jgi:hypothetical protein